MPDPISDAKKGEPADPEYDRLCELHTQKERCAGIFLVSSFRCAADPIDAKMYRELAEDCAKQAVYHQACMKAWRLAHGWDQ